MRKRREGRRKDETNVRRKEEIRRRSRKWGGGKR